MITIDQDVRQLIRMPLDIFNMSEKYVTSNEIFIFQSPSLWTLEKNLFFLFDFWNQAREGKVNY